MPARVRISNHRTKVHARDEFLKDISGPALRAVSRARDSSPSSQVGNALRYRPHLAGPYDVLINIGVFRAGFMSRRNGLEERVAKTPRPTLAQMLVILESSSVPGVGPLSPVDANGNSYLVAYYKGGGATRLYGPVPVNRDTKFLYKELVRLARRYNGGAVEHI